MIHRRLADPRIRQTSKPTDIFILLFIYFQLWLGILAIPDSLANLDGTYMLVLAEWARSILLFRPGSAELVNGVPWQYKVHLVSGMTLFFLVPFTRLVHVWSAPIWFLGRPGWQIGQARDYAAIRVLVRRFRSVSLLPPQSARRKRRVERE